MPMKPLLSLSPSRSSLHNSLQAGAGRKPRLLLIPKGGGARGSIVKTSFHGESCCCGLKKGPRRGSSLPNLFFISFGHAEDACRDRRDDAMISLSTRKITLAALSWKRVRELDGACCSIHMLCYRVMFWQSRLKLVHSLPSRTQYKAARPVDM